MPDDLTKRRLRDSHLINHDQECEVRYWCDRFDCTTEELQDAAGLVGDSVAAVQTSLSLS